MIVFLVLLIIAIAVGALLATLMVRDAGYVLISYDGATVETSLWFALAAALALVLVVYAVVLLTRRVLGGGSAISGWVRSRRTTTARNRTVRGLMLLAEERWQEAGEAFEASAERVDTPLFNHLAAARAASEQGRVEERDAILKKAREATPEAAFAVNLVRAELQQSAGQWRASLDTLGPLRSEAPRHPVVIKRLFEAHKALDDWEAVAELASELPKDAQADDVQTAIWRARLTRSRQSADAAEHARKAWKSIPKKLRTDEQLLLDFVDAVAADAPDEAEAALRQALKGGWRDAWVRRYGKLDADPGKQLARAVVWSKQHPDDPVLLLTLGRLANATGDAAKAREYLEASLSREEDAEALEELAAVCAATGDAVAANGHYRHALRLKP
ncbi:MAG: hypothetical protein J4F45_05100 [Pseudomonadales bacterium]|nr:hypothetical protein [Pseudomonadales bacterium]